MHIGVAWDEQLIDPLGCSLQLRDEVDGSTALLRQIRISDLPADPAPAAREPRESHWSERTLQVRLPRGPRHSNFGLALLSPDGRLLDERPVVARVEKIGFSLSIGGGTAQEFAVGDPEGPPSVDERDEAIRLARDLEREARKAAAARRMSASGELTAYLHWRFSCRAGELLVADPFLLGSDPEAAAALLAAMRRPVRALSGGIPETARDILSASGEWLEVRALQGGRKALRDRVWIVGETGLLVGTSITDLVREASSARAAATTVTELPSADTVAWREQFEQWWRNAHSLGRA